MRLTLALAAAVAALSLSACGSDDAAEPADSAASTGSAAAQSSAPPTGEAAEQITFTTNYGPIVVRTDPTAEQTVVAQSALAEQGYFDGTVCHRVVTEGIYVLQCGDPTGTGTGGPDYTLPDENLPEAEEGNYPAGTVAMANAGPNTGGSQFFVVYRKTTLPPGYTIWGEVTEGLDVVKEIGRENAKAGVTDGPPAEQVTIESATTG